MKIISKKPQWLTAITTLCLVAITLFAVVSCNELENESKQYTLHFAGEEIDIEPQLIEYGKHATAPENPERESYDFGGWFIDNVTFANEWNFETDIVTQDTTLYAKWEEFEQKILDGYAVTAIAFDSKGNAWIGTQGKGLIRYNTNETVIYNSENSILPEDFWISDIAVDKNDNVWIGADGAWKYDGEEFTLYNSQNTTMPEDVVWSIAVDSKNNIWFASCRFRQGGLVKYDGTKWTSYTPDNSPLPTNSVKGIAIDKSDNIWLALSDYVNLSYLVKISNDKWNVYDENDLGFTPYYLGGIQCDSKNRLWGAIDYSLSGTWVSPPPHFFIFDGQQTTLLSCGDDISIRHSKIMIDSNDYVWCFGSGSVCGVWIDEQWTQLDNSEFGGSSVWVIKEAPNRRIWFGTTNGIYIRNKQKCL